MHTSDPDENSIVLCTEERYTQAVVDQLNGAKRQVLVWAYSSCTITTPIDRALVDAYKRGVDVQVILDKSSEMYSGATFLAIEGVPTYIDPVHEIAHDTFMVIDGKTIITFTESAEKSAEKRTFFNFLKSAAQRLFDKPNPFGDICFAGPVAHIHNIPESAVRSTADWKEHLGHSEPYQAR